MLELRGRGSCLLAECLALLLPPPLQLLLLLLLLLLCVFHALFQGVVGHEGVPVC